jgi:predicted nucleotidyltransferase
MLSHATGCHGREPPAVQQTCVPKVLEFLSRLLWYIWASVAGGEATAEGGGSCRARMAGQGEIDSLSVASSAQEAFREFHRRRDAERRELREQQRLEVLAQVREAVPRYAARYPPIRRVYVFGSIVQAGRFSTHSDIDLAVDSDDIASETPMWRDLERALQRNVDLRPLLGAVAYAVSGYGELCYARRDGPT